MSAVATAEQVLEFWLGAPITNQAEAQARFMRWFQGGPSLDESVRARFVPTIEAALRGELDTWAETPRGLLALVLVLDQMTRNAFRGTPRAWAGDRHALRLARRALDGGMADELSWVERVFLRMPFAHAEDDAMQAISVRMARGAGEDVPVYLAAAAERGLQRAVEYQKIIARFGRFPFRNAALGRETTPEEAEFLRTFGPPGGGEPARVPPAPAPTRSLAIQSA